MNFVKENITLSSLCKKGSAEFGVDGDVIVPDVLPDILKILQVDGRVTLNSKKITDGRITCEGSVNLKILYIPEDEQSKLKSISTSFDFSHTVGGLPTESGCFVDASVDISKVDYTLINSRKLRIKSVEVLNYSVIRAEKLELITDTLDDISMEMCQKNVSVCDFIGFKDTQFLVRESLELPSGQNSVCDLLKVDASVYETEYKMLENRVVLKGVCGICALFTDVSGNIRYSDFEMPFTEIIEIENAAETSVCDVEYSVNDITYRAEADSDGDVRIIVAEVLVGAKINTYETKNISYISDCYCPGKQLILDSEFCTVDNIINEGKINCSVREVVVPQENTPAVSGIYNLIVKPVIESTKVEQGRVSVEGKLICYCLYICSADDLPVFSTRHEFRFCENIEIDGAEPGCGCDVKAEIAHKNYALNSAGETEIKIVLGLEASVAEKTEIPVIHSCEVCNKNDDDKKGIVVYFVCENETLWDIGKKYAVPVDDIMELNGLENTSADKGMKLLIPSV